MRHVRALRVSKTVLVFAIAVFYTILVLNNITDYGSNYEFVRHVLMMDSTFPGNHGMWRAVNSPLVACRREFVTTDAVSRVGVLPVDRLSIG